VKLYSFINLGARWGCVVNATPRTVYPSPGKQTWYPLRKRLGGVQGSSGQVRKISPPLGIDVKRILNVIILDVRTNTYLVLLYCVKTWF
jgi:hypothetical protein